MRYSIVFTGALATVASASPAFFKRYYVTEYAYVTDVVTVTAGQEPAPTPSSKAEVSVAAVPTSKAWGYGGGWWGGNQKTTTQAPAPAPTTPTSVYTPPPPPPTTYTPPPPPPTTTQPPPPPATTEAPAPVTTTEAPAPATTAAQAPTKSAPKGYGGSPAYSDIVVMHHNLHRANHSAPDLEWDQDLADTAFDIANSCVYEHDVLKNGGGYGQNIAAGAPADNISSIITDHFYNEEIGWFQPFFGQSTPSDMSTPTFDKFGHFTQIVWKGTKKVGCATVNCSGRGKGPKGLDKVDITVPPYFIVCNYSPPGNYLGEFGDNVELPDGKATENWSWGL